jgi:hypothetical protein
MNPLRTAAGLALLCIAAGGAVAQAPQGLPTAQPRFISIWREQVKVGRGEEHARIEAGWPAAYTRAKSPDYYLAMVSLTGTPEAWFVAPFASQAARGESLQREASDPVLSAELARLSRADADVVENLRIIEAVARPELSHGAYPELARQRFWEISVFCVRPGHGEEFAAAVTAYKTATERAGAGAGWRTYEVTGGMPSPTYIIFASVTAYGEFDKMMSDDMRIIQSATTEERATLQKFFKESAISYESNRFRLDPRMSYVSAEVRATDPVFWNPPSARRATSGGN